MVNRTFLEIPQDILKDGVIQGTLQRIIEEIDVITGNRVSKTGQLLNEQQVLDLISLNSSDNAKQTTIAEVSSDTITISAAYVQAESEALKTGVDDNKDRINDIIQLLKDADLMEV